LASSRSNVPIRRQFPAGRLDARKRRGALFGAGRTRELGGSRADDPHLDLVAPTLDQLLSVVAPIKHLAGFINFVCRSLITCDSGRALYNSSGLAPARGYAHFFHPFELPTAGRRFAQPVLLCASKGLRAANGLVDLQRAPHRNNDGRCPGDDWHMLHLRRHRHAYAKSPCPRAIAAGK